MAKDIPELLAQAILIDKRCKRHARECGMHAQKLAQDAREDDSPTTRRIKEVLANNLNEMSGKMRYAPAQQEPVKKSVSQIFINDVLSKGISDVFCDGESVVVNGLLGVLFDAEYDPVAKGWQFDLTTAIDDANFVVLVCKSLGDMIRQYILSKSQVLQYTDLDYEYAPIIGEVFVPVHDVDFLDYRDNTDMFI